MNFKVKNISKKYGKNIVIKSFSYEFKSGLYLLTGKNGTGKSTLLKLIAQVINPTNNKYFIDKRKVAYLCENVELLNSNVLSFLTTVSKINNSNKNIKDLLEKWQIPNKNIMSLSNGNKQKVSLIMMSLVETDVYLFDEPTNALDDRTLNIFLELVNELILKEKIIVISTHDKQVFNSFRHEEIRLEC